MLLPRVFFKVVFACGLAAALLLAQTLGLVHGVVHSGASGHAHTHTAAHDHADEAVHDHAGADLMFAGHDGDKDCRLYDQASHGGMLALLVALALPVVLPPIAVAIFQGNALARWAALFDARGPPLTL
jgi:hypothetical protein